jgi:hypothetical protein
MPEIAKASFPLPVIMYDKIKVSIVPVVLQVIALIKERE